jgi:cytochrome c oxidase cbb3-type subunit III
MIAGTDQIGEKDMRHHYFPALLAAFLVLVAGIAGSQETQTGAQEGAQEGAQPQATYQTMTPEQRAAATRTFLGLGPEPDKAAAARGTPLFQQNCAFCHGPQARGATGNSLITSDEVLGDDHGERLVAFLKRGRPEKGMPAFATMSDDQLTDISEFLHLQVEEVANRGTYHVLNILVGNAAKGQVYVTEHCTSCHKAETFVHIGSRFRSPEQLQRGWIWPVRPNDSEDTSKAIVATVKTRNGTTIAGRVTQVSDFHITLVDPAGETYGIEREPGVEVEITDPLAAHQEMIMTLTNEDMHNVTAYLETQK